MENWLKWKKEYKLGSFFFYIKLANVTTRRICLSIVALALNPINWKCWARWLKSRSRGFANVFPVNTPEDREAFDKLCRAYIEARYNRLFTVSEEQYEYMLARTEALREVTIRECAARIAYYDKMIEKEENSLI